MSEPTKHFTEEQVKAAAASGGYVVLTVTEADGTVNEYLATAAAEPPAEKED